MTENIFRNPFVGCTARDMTYDEVHQYWCSPFRLYDLRESELFTSKTPIVIEGIRGTGKTMIMKYLSYFIQKKSCDSELPEDKLKYFQKKSIGVYFRYKADFCNLFVSLDCSVEDKRRIFRQYYEFFIIRQILEILDDFYKDSDSSKVVEILCTFFDIDEMSISGILQYINARIKEMDQIINTSIYDERWRDKMMPLIDSGGLVTDLIRKISNDLPGWGNMLFVILLDEYENLGAFQTIINTLIKQVDDSVNLTYRLGMRPAGMDNNGTNVANEYLQVDRDFLLQKLEYENHEEYREFAINISRKRLESIPVFYEHNLCNISDLLGEKENFDKEANSVARGKKQFDILKKYFPDLSQRQDVINVLSCDEKLMEMYNILRVMRGSDYKEIGALCKKYRELRDAKRLSELKEQNTDEAKKLKKYHLDYSSKYRVALLYVLLTIYGERKQYYSVNTFLRLSSGSINDFISLCRNTFKHMNSDMLEELKKGKRISSRIQNLAAMDTAEDQRRKASMGNRNGDKIYLFIDMIGDLFEAYHRDLAVRFPETNQFAFADENEIRNDEQLREYLVELINSGTIIRKNQRQRKTFDNTKRGYLYMLNRIFAPIYQYSYRTRGGFNPVISTEDFRTMWEGSSIDLNKYLKCKNEELQQVDMSDYYEKEDKDDPANL